MNTTFSSFSCFLWVTCFKQASKHDGKGASSPSARETGVPCVENVSCEKNEVPGCMAELKAVNSVLMSPPMSSKMSLS